MKTRKAISLTLILAAVVALGGILQLSSSANASAEAVLLVPECDCWVYNYPEPGDPPIPGVRDDTRECFLDPCAMKMDDEIRVGF